MVTYTGMDAIEYAERHGMELSKYQDPVEDAREGLSVEEARGIAREDPNLIHLEVEEMDYYIDEADMGSEWDLGADGVREVAEAMTDILAERHVPVVVRALTGADDEASASPYRQANGEVERVYGRRTIEDALTEAVSIVTGQED